MTKGRNAVKTGDNVNLEKLVKFILADTNSPHVVIGPIAWQPSDGLSGKRRYFVVSTSEKDRGWRCDGITIEDDALRTAFILALFETKKPLVIHDMDCELGAARICELLWPGDRITALRKAVEAEHEAARAA